MINRRVFGIFILLFFSAQFFSQMRKNPLQIKSKTDYIHESSKITFPKQLDGFERKVIVSYDQKNYNVGTVYELVENKKKSKISVYLYPADISNDNLREQFAAFQIAMDRNSINQPKLKPEFVKLPSENITVNGILSVFDYDIMIPDYFKGQKEQRNKSLISIYDAGQWNLKVRITSENYDQKKITELEKKVLETFSPTKLAEHFVINYKRNSNILISKTAQNDSMMIKATIAEAEAKKEWIGTNKPIAELATGFSDIEIESHEFAIQKKLQFYRENQGKLEENENTKQFFKNLQAVVDNGFLKEFIYEQTFGVVKFTPSEERQKLYLDFKTNNSFPESFSENLYRIYY